MPLQPGTLRALSIAAFMAGGTVFTGCTRPVTDYFTLAPSQQASLEGSGTDLGAARVCYQEQFAGVRDTQFGKLDILFLTDTSGSLDVERSAVAAGISELVGALPASLDYQVAVMLAHGDLSPWGGKLYKKAAEALVLKSATMTLSQIRTALTTKLTQTVDDPETDGGELGLHSLSRSLDSDRLPAIQSAGFYRPDAALAVVTISDENDICAIYPDGVVPVPDPQGLEITAHAKYCRNTNPLTTYSKFNDFMGARPLVFGGVHYLTPDRVAGGGESEVGYGWLDLIKLGNGGTLVNAPVADMFDTSQIASGLRKIGEAASNRLAMELDYKLGRNRVDPASVKLQVDGKAASGSFVPETNEVHLNESGLFTRVVVDYCLLPAI